MTAASQSGSIAITGTPTSFQLFQNYPNPFNPSTTIKYQIPQDNIRVRIEVYNVVGQLVRTLADIKQNAGEYEIVWDGTNSQNIQVASGIYFYRMQAGDFVSLKKFHLLK
jgi:flagellar hook assembly protein FlgD